MEYRRRDLLKASLFTATLLTVGCSPRFAEREEFIRPPGALPESQFRATCIGCNVCLNLCHALKFNSLALAGGWRNFGTPYVNDMRDYPCTLCMECPKFCPTRALQPVSIEKVRMGMALIDLSLCLGWNGDVCLSCSKACPLGAIIFDFYPSDWGNQPMINEHCKGCGVCVKHCPVGISAISVLTWKSYDQKKNDYRSGVERVLAMNPGKRYAWVYDQNMPKILEAGKVLERGIR